MRWLDAITNSMNMGLGEVWAHWSIDGVEVRWGYIWATGHLSNWVIHRWLRCKNLPAVQDTQEMQVQSLGREDALEEGMATHSSILAWRIPWTE